MSYQHLSMMLEWECYPPMPTTVEESPDSAFVDGIIASTQHDHSDRHSQGRAFQVGYRFADRWGERGSDIGRRMMWCREHLDECLLNLARDGFAATQSETPTAAEVDAMLVDGFISVLSGVSYLEIEKRGPIYAYAWGIASGWCDLGLELAAELKQLRAAHK